jgi:Phosphopantetheinyl transferase
MPIFYQQEIDANARLGIWEIKEEESFFKQFVPIHREVSHPHKRLQHLAGRFLLKYLYPDFPSHLISIADTKKPFLPDETYHFSISHCGNYAAAIVSRHYRVGIDIEIPSDKVIKVQHKFVSDAEMAAIHPLTQEDFTRIWSAKEAVFKWYGNGKVDFKKDICLLSYANGDNTFRCLFKKNNSKLIIHTHAFPELCLSYLLGDSVS